MTWQGESLGSTWGYDTPSGDANPTGTGDVTIPGLTLTIDCPGPAAVYFVDIDADISIATNGTSCLVELWVDGAAQTGAIRCTGQSGDRESGHRRWVLTGLAVGSHNLVGHTHNSAGTTNAVVNAANTAMSYQRVA